MDTSNKKQPFLFASVLRIFATLLIFVFHFRGLSDLPKYPIDKVGIFIFLVISGFFAYQPGITPIHWLIKRVKQIMVPYWTVILVVLVVNRIVEYKETDFFTALIIFFGGSLFISNPVYVIAWFITYILLLYFCLFIFLRFQESALSYAFLIVSGLIFWIFEIANPCYFIGFFGGYFLNKFLINNKQKNIKNSFYSNINLFFYTIQNYSYSFFLIHGGILKLTFFFFSFRGFIAFISTFFLTAIISFYHKKLSDFLLAKFSFLEQKFIFYYEKN
jgi:hypothetical protein